MDLHPSHLYSDITCLMVLSFPAASMACRISRTALVILCVKLSL